MFAIAPPPTPLTTPVSTVRPSIGRGALETSRRRISPSATIRARAFSPAMPIKLLDLLTNRYHLGIVRAASRDGMQVEVSATSHLLAGRQVRFVLAEEAPSGIVSRQAMHTAVVTQVQPNEAGKHIDIQLAMQTQPVAV